MSWVRLDDQFTDHPKIVQAGPLAGWLYICGLTYANRYLTDGRIPAAQVRRLADVDGADELAARLVAAGLWEVVDGGYQIHDYLEYQPSADTVRKEREATAHRVQEWRERKKAARNASSNSVTYPPSNKNVTGTAGVCNTDVTALPDVTGSVTLLVTPHVTPPPSHPIPSHPKDIDRDLESDLDLGEGGIAPARAPVTTLPKRTPAKRAPTGLVITDEHRALARELFVDVEAEAAKFRDHCAATGKPYKDYGAAFRNWLRRAPAYIGSANGYSRPAPRAAPKYRQASDIMAELGIS